MRPMPYKYAPYRAIFQHWGRKGERGLGAVVDLTHSVHLLPFIHLKICSIKWYWVRGFQRQKVTVLYPCPGGLYMHVQVIGCKDGWQHPCPLLCFLFLICIYLLTSYATFAMCSVYLLI
jgi:hypothetical protein